MVATKEHYEKAKRLLKNYCFDEEYYLAEIVIDSYENGTSVSEGTLRLLDADIEVQCNGTIRFI